MTTCVRLLSSVPISGNARIPSHNVTTGVDSSSISCCCRAIRASRLRWNTSVPLRLNEFAILIIGRQWRSQVEWFAHAPIATKAGLSPQIIAELKQKKRPSNMAEDEAVVYDFVTELTATQKVSDATYARAKKIFNDQQIVDLTAVAGNYVMVAMILAAAEATVPPDKQEPFKPGEE